MSLQNLYQDLIIDHASQPRNHHALADSSMRSEGFNPLCGDKITLYLKLQNDIIEEISFEGKGCAISMASASLLTEFIKGKTLDQAKAYFLKIQELFTSDQDFPEELGKITALSGVRTFPGRVKCATLAWHSLHLAIKKLQSLATTAASPEHSDMLASLTTVTTE